MDSRNFDISYKESLEWLFSQLPMFSRIGAAAYKPGLENTLALDNLYNHPHTRFKSIHVAGTNGKGSTSHMIASALQAQGYKTGLYTSPHLTDFRERMRINGKMIPREAVVDFIEGWKAKSTELKPSFFELTMMMAFDWFAKEEVDVAVIEVGMGGRLDSTNIITPVLSVITNISFDHTQFLGNTLEAIAAEKAGIIKHGIPVIIGKAENEVRKVFIQKSESENAPVFFADNFEDIRGLVRTSDGWTAEMRSGQQLHVPLAGEYQKENIKTVLCALAALNKIGLLISDDNIREGLEHVCEATGLRGRWQIMASEPTVICDTGHNLDGLKENMLSLKERYPDRNIRFVVGFVNDKDVAHIVDLFPEDGIYYFTRASIPRAMPADEVAVHFSKRNIKGTVFKNVKEAFESAISDSRPDDVIYVGGSTFIVADYLAFYN